MTSILRSGRSIRPITTIRSSLAHQQGRRLYGQSSYGDGEPHPEDGRNKPTRDIEHPGRPPPNVNKGSPGSNSQPQSQHQSSSASEEKSKQKARVADSKRTSNNANPTITDGHQSDNVDLDGNTKADVPDDVKRHNEDIDRRYDKPYNWIKDEGKVGNGF
ncbi:hypothetical protein BDW59DRAFT_59800 [Aspergillus cavernicola]|uniref:Uncharacterized protein n=1 Tax=Aspergillus cavernicola TaxID=176166 RepID=A0ABR4IH45_9EURO